MKHNKNFNYSWIGNHGNYYDRSCISYYRTHGEWKIYKSSTSKSTLTETTDSGTVRSFPQISFLLYLGM